MNLMTTSEQAVFATVEGVPWVEPPADLYIPPDALEVLLDRFTGPLDLLLYLIRRQNLDIMNIPMTTITAQYIQYIEWLESQRLELAADYLVMAAILLEIKSKMLLPQLTTVLEEEEDPRMALVRRLQQYEQFKQAAYDLDTRPRQERDVFKVQVHCESEQGMVRLPPTVELKQLIDAWEKLNQRQAQHQAHAISRETLSVREKMGMILSAVSGDSWLDWTTLLVAAEAQQGAVVSFLAILELTKQALISVMQAELFTPIYLQAV